MTDKKYYYVSVSGKAIETEPSRSEQLQVFADDEEIEVLRDMLDRERKDDERTHLKAPIPYKSADHDPATEKFNDDLTELYFTIYQIGTKETKAHIRRMNILQELQDTDYNHPGYEDK